MHILLSHLSGSTTYLFTHEAPGQQAVNLEERVLTHRAVIAPPGERGQIFQEVSLRPGGRNRSAGARPTDALASSL